MPKKKKQYVELTQKQVDQLYGDAIRLAAAVKLYLHVDLYADAHATANRVMKLWNDNAE